MVGYMKTASALVLATASLAAAQNATILLGAAPAVTDAPSATVGGIHISIGLEFTYTTTILSLCPTGLIPVPYTITQHCPTGHCTQPLIPNGWQVTTKDCNVCGPKPTQVVVTECPYANPTAQPECNDCHHDVIVHTAAPTCNVCKPEIKTMTHVYPQPTPTPYACETCIIKPTPIPVIYTTYQPSPLPTPIKTVVVPCTTCKPLVPATSQVIVECKTCALTVTQTAPCPSQPPVVITTITPVCPGPYCSKTVTTIVPCATCPPVVQKYSTVILPPPAQTVTQSCPGGPNCPAPPPVIVKTIGYSCPGSPNCPATTPVVVPPPAKTAVNSCPGGPNCPPVVVQSYTTVIVPPPAMTGAASCPGGPNCPATTAAPVCPGGPNCPATTTIVPQTPYSNVTIPKPPTYTGAAMKNVASGAFGLVMAIAAAALL